MPFLDAYTWQKERVLNFEFFVLRVFLVTC